MSEKNGEGGIQQQKGENLDNSSYTTDFTNNHQPVQRSSHPKNGSRKALSFTGNHMPPELLEKILGYMDSTDKGLLLLCNMALVCTNFYNYFTNSALWGSTPKTGNYILLQNTVSNNIWESQSLNDWYNGLFTESGTIKVPRVKLPPEIWLHRKLLTMVLTEFPLTLVCAPSFEDMKPYASDPVIASLFLQHIPHGEFFAFCSSKVRECENIAFRVIRRFPGAISHCPTSLLNDREFVKKAVNVSGECLKYLGDYRQDSELVISASRTFEGAIKLARGQAKADIDRITTLNTVIPEKPAYGQRCQVCHRYN